jgi:broad specificity phosphatase PhoE
MAIFVARHGETELNAARVIQMPTTPLSERGRRQAERLGARMAPLGIVRILTSDFVRAIETAEAIAATTGAPIEIDPLLRERNFGDIRGTPYNELGRDPFAADYHPPNGESWAMFHERVARAWELVARVAADTSGNLAVVTHGLVCRVLVDRHLALPVGSSAPELWGNTALTEIEAAAPWQIRTLACCAHLVPDDGPAGAQA